MLECLTDERLMGLSSLIHRQVSRSDLGFFSPPAPTSVARSWRTQLFMARRWAGHLDFRNGRGSRACREALKTDPVACDTEAGGLAYGADDKCDRVVAIDVERPARIVAGCKEATT
jgi:hypothetical protein